MKTRSFLSLLILIIFASTFSAFSQNAPFSGQWKLNREKTVLAPDQLFLAAITVMLKSDTLFTTRTYENPNGEQYPFDENITLDGKDCKIVIYDMPRMSKALKPGSDGLLNIESTTTFQGQNGEENLVAKEIWKVDSDTLTINFTNKMAAGEITGINYYTKVK
jgi:hypothetical protein